MGEWCQTDGIALRRSAAFLKELNRGANRCSRGQTVEFADEYHIGKSNQDAYVATVYERLGRDERLRLVLSSATMDLEALRQYFAAFSVNHVHIEGQMFPVRQEHVLGTTLEVIMEYFPKVAPGKKMMVLEAGKGEIRELRKVLLKYYDQKQILELHSQVPHAMQDAVKFRYPYPVLILATGIARDSNTYPGLVTLYDSCRKREPVLYGEHCMHEGLVTAEISKAEFDQARGRLGRIEEDSPGLHLYAIARDDLSFDYPQREVEYCALDGMNLRLKVDGNVHPNDLHFFVAPSRQGVIQADDRLVRIGCYDLDHEPTALGKRAAAMPTSPQNAVMGLYVGDREPNLAWFGFVLAGNQEMGGMLLPGNPKGKALAKDKVASDFLRDILLYLRCLELRAEGQSENWFYENGIDYKAFCKQVEIVEKICKVENCSPFDQDHLNGLEGRRREKFLERLADLANEAFLAGYPENLFVAVGNKRGKRQFAEAHQQGLIFELSRDSSVDRASLLVIGRTHTFDKDNPVVCDASKRRLCAASGVPLESLLNVYGSGFLHAIHKQAIDAADDLRYVNRPRSRRR
ncbi:MAG: hypothetical protein IT292_06450 [Deltaproteobacteria bacterium]|nr:hypothetical protein [Deltaproteobacteria bacterium]